MNKYDEHYSAYFAAPDEKYPSGAAVDASSEDSLDGTPYLAAFFNDVIGFMGAVFYGVFGNPRKSGDTVTRDVTGEPDNAKKSDVWDAIKTFVQGKADAVQKSLDDFVATKGKASGFAPLDENGLVPTQYMAEATQDDEGLMSAVDKKKLDGIESGAQKNAVTSVSGRTGAVTSAQLLSDMAVMTGATASAAGAKGLVPAPAQGQQDAFLKGNGTWGMPASAVIDSVLSTTSTNAVQNKAVTLGLNGAICESVETAETKEIDIPGFAMFIGCMVKVLFKKANTKASPKLRVKGFDEYSIVAYRNGSPVPIDTTTSASGATLGWDAGTTMELMWDGANWVVMGNPVLLSNFGTDSGYIKYANGFCIQMFNVSLKGDYFETEYKFPIAFTTACISVTGAAQNYDNQVGISFCYRDKSRTGFRGRLLYGGAPSPGVGLFISVGY